MDIEFDAHILDNAATKQNLVKSSEFLEHGSRKSGYACDNAIDINPNHNLKQHNGTVSFKMDNPNLDFPRESKRISTSYVDRYFEQPKYFDEDGSGLSCSVDKALRFTEERSDKFDKMNNLEHSVRSSYAGNIQEQTSMMGNNRASGQQQLYQNKVDNCEQTLLQDKTSSSNFEMGREETPNYDLLKEKTANLDTSRSKPIKFDSQREKISNIEVGTRPKLSSSFSDSSKINITEFTKKIDIAKARASKVAFVPRSNHPGQETKSIVYGSSDSIKTNLQSGTSDNGSARGNVEAVRINIQSFRKIEQNQNGFDAFPFVISNNPLFIAESDKKESPIYSSSESLRVNFQRLRRKSDAEANSQVELSSKILAEKYQREVSGLESVKSYLDSKKGQGLSLGLGKLTQNMMQLGKNIGQNSMSNKAMLPNVRKLDLPSQSQVTFRNLNVPLQKPKHLDLNIPLQSQQQQQQQQSSAVKLNITQKANPPTSPGSIHQHILEPPKLYQNETTRKELPKSEQLPVVEKPTSNATNVYRHRTSSLSENRKPPSKNVRRSFHPRNDSSEDSDSVSHSETDIRSRLRYKRRSKKVPHSLRLNFKNKGQFLHPDSARGFSSVELCGKSPPPSTSFLNSLSPPFSSRNNLLSWPESAPSSSLTFTSNSDLDSDTSSEYPEFTNDILTFPPSPAP